MENPTTSILNNTSPAMSTVNTNNDFWKVIGVLGLLMFMLANGYSIYYTHLQIKEHYKRKKLENNE